MNLRRGFQPTTVVDGEQKRLPVDRCQGLSSRNLQVHHVSHVCIFFAACEGGGREARRGGVVGHARHGHAGQRRNEKKAVAKRVIFFNILAPGPYSGHRLLLRIYGVGSYVFWFFMDGTNPLSSWEAPLLSSTLLARSLVCNEPS